MSQEHTLYRKYRPQTFQEVLGQEQVVCALEGALAQGRVGHAYLFAGTRGTGKTSVARIFARALNIHERDVYEIDAASNNGVDEMRALGEEIYTLPFHSERKLYILDEAHMLSKAAWNAFLKTLEEPPAHAMFILATTELEKVPETILSRCQIFTFKTPSTSTIREMITRTAEKEGYTLAQSSVELIALIADGSFRDAHSTLQKVFSSVKEKNILPETIEAILGAPKSTHIVALLDAIAERSGERAFTVVHTLRTSEAHMRTVIKLILHFVRAILLVRTAPSLQHILRDTFNEEAWQAILRHAEASKKEIHSSFLLLLLDALARAGTSYTPELPLEVALLQHFERLEKEC